MQHAKAPVVVQTISAGKLRRYHGESWNTRLLDFKTMWLNVRDISKVLLGFIQSLWLLISNRPDVVFAKGGYVSLPMGIAARLLGIRLVIHDSDARPGLTNRVLGRIADVIGTGTPLQNYNYDPAKTSYVGVPIQGFFRPFSERQMREARSVIGMIDLNAPLVVVTGGGLGSKIINDSMIDQSEALIKEGIHVYHVAGKKHFEAVKEAVVQHPHYQVVPFVYRDMDKVLGAADVVVTRASATFLQELAGLAKPIIAIPAAHLSDQLKNAEVYRKSDAAIVLSDKDITDSDRLGKELIELLSDKAKSTRLSQNLHQFARPNAARDMAELILRSNHKHKKGRPRAI